MKQQLEETTSTNTDIAELLRLERRRREDGEASNVLLLARTTTRHLHDIVAKDSLLASLQDQLEETRSAGNDLAELLQ